MSYNGLVKIIMPVIYLPMMEENPGEVSNCRKTTIHTHSSYDHIYYVQPRARTNLAVHATKISQNMLSTTLIGSLKESSRWIPNYIYVPLIHGAMGWPSVCDCGTAWSYSLTSWVVCKKYGEKISFVEKYCCRCVCDAM